MGAYGERASAPRQSRLHVGNAFDGKNYLDSAGDCAFGVSSQGFVQRNRNFTGTDHCHFATRPRHRQSKRFGVEANRAVHIRDADEIMLTRKGGSVWANTVPATAASRRKVVMPALCPATAPVSCSILRICDVLQTGVHRILSGIAD